METKNFFNGLFIKANDSAQPGDSDCSLCCLSGESCADCPLQPGFYFAEPSSNCIHCSGMSEHDKSKLDDVVKALLWLADDLMSSRNLSLVQHSTISMAISVLELQLQRLSLITTFDK